MGRFAPATSCAVWVQISVALIEKVDHLGKITCKDRQRSIADGGSVQTFPIVYTPKRLKPGQKALNRGTHPQTGPGAFHPVKTWGFAFFSPVEVLAKMAYGSDMKNLTIVSRCAWKRRCETAHNQCARGLLAVDRLCRWIVGTCPGDLLSCSGHAHLGALECSSLARRKNCNGKGLGMRSQASNWRSAHLGLGGIVGNKGCARVKS